LRRYQVPSDAQPPVLAGEHVRSVCPFERRRSLNVTGVLELDTTLSV
jgi:hypothetical protein